MRKEVLAALDRMAVRMFEYKPKGKLIARKGASSPKRKKQK